MDDVNLVTARCLQWEVQRARHILSPHVSAELPRDDVTAVIVQNRTEIEPAPTKNLDVVKVGLLKLVNRRRLIFELAGNFNDDEGGACD